MHFGFSPLVLGKLGPIHEAMEPIIRSLNNSHNLNTSLGQIAKPTFASLEYLLDKSHWKCNWEILLQVPINRGICQNHLCTHLCRNGIQRRIPS